MDTEPRRKRRSRREECAEGPDALAPELRDALIRAGLAVGSPLGADTPGRPAPRRGLDASGRDVVIHLLDLPDDASRARTLRRLDELRALVHPGLAPVRDVIFLPDDWAAVVIDLIVGADLAVVLGARGGLTRAEAARVLDDVGSALAHLHDHGVTHGDVSPANVMVTTEGALVLIDLFGGILETGTDGCAAPERRGGGPATPASDVYALAALLRECASGSALLRAQLERILPDALDADPRRRPTARALAARAHELAGPGRIVLPDGARLAAGALRAAAARPTRVVPTRRGLRRRADAEADTRSGRRRLAQSPEPRRGRRRLWAVLGVLSAVALVGAGILKVGLDASARTPPATGAGVVSAAPETGRQTADGDGLLAVVVDLTGRRDAALNAGDAQALALTTVPGSPAAEADAAVLDALAAAGESVDGLDTSILSVVEVSVPEDCGTWADARAVRIRQSQPASTRTGVDGTVRTVPAQTAREVVLVLVPGPWRVAEVREA
ncbi:serine/threonine-protein kinase [Actinomyces sp.]|uniref:serine/threonine-protein kinase n=1 Tax=Actinomyces sp. TaxID=29317 RepID=UPI0026DC2641|nr:protein kinase [Actinomyces sp.]MDO4900040.1 protein kinase [Actinomyces sp.]